MRRWMLGLVWLLPAAAPCELVYFSGGGIGPYVSLDTSPTAVNELGDQIRLAAGPRDGINMMVGVYTDNQFTASQLTLRFYLNDGTMGTFGLRPSTQIATFIRPSVLIQAGIHEIYFDLGLFTLPDEFTWTLDAGADNSRTYLRYTDSTQIGSSSNDFIWRKRNGSWLNSHATSTNSGNLYCAVTAVPEPSSLLPLLLLVAPRLFTIIRRKQA